MFDLCCDLIPVPSISGSWHLVSMLFLSSAIWFPWSVIFLLIYAFCYLIFCPFLGISYLSWICDRLFVLISWGFFSRCEISCCCILASAFIFFSSILLQFRVFYFHLVFFVSDAFSFDLGFSFSGWVCRRVFGKQLSFPKSTLKIRSILVCSIALSWIRSLRYLKIA